MDLVAHPGNYFRFCRLEAHLTRFPYVVGERLLTEEVFSFSHAIQTHAGVHVVGCADGHGIHLVAHLGKHFTVVLKDGRIRVFLSGACGANKVHVAQGDVLRLGVTGHGSEVRSTSSLCAYGGELQFRVQVATAHYGGSHRKGGKSGGGLKKTSAIHWFCFFEIFTSFAWEVWADRPKPLFRRFWP